MKTLPRLLAALVLCTLAQVPATVLADDKLEFNRDIRPILAENCFACHGPDSAARKADLRLDKREAAIDMAAITPGDLDASEAIRRILSDDPDEVMPPPDSHKKLSTKQKNLLKRWVAEGAEYQPHWSFIAPVRPQLPRVKNAAWVRNAIDAFILKKLEAKKLSPAPEADRRTLARRLSIDLTGLPPEPEMVEAFVNDESPDAYEKLVDQLLASPQWGEHRARYWLDAARYADTHGYHHDNYREMYSYRDWVIKAFNRNLPFSQFAVEQLAGDLLPDSTLDQQVATGFNRCNMTSNEGGLIDEEYLMLYTRDRTETASQIFLGLTAGCAVCHDHKFDPLSQREFYELSAFFNNSTQGPKDGNIKDTPPVIFVPREEDRERFAAIPGELAEARRQLEERRKTARQDFDQWVKKAEPIGPQVQVPEEALVLHAPLSEGTDKTVDVAVRGKTRPVACASLEWEDGAIAPRAMKLSPDFKAEMRDVGDFEYTQPFSCAAWIRFNEQETTGAIIGRMKDSAKYRGWDFWVENNRVGMHLVNTWPNYAIKAVAAEPLAPNQWHQVTVTYDGSGQVGGIKVYYNGKPQRTVATGKRIARTIRTPVPLKFAQRDRNDRISNVVLQDIRLYEKSLTDSEVNGLALGPRAVYLSAKPLEERTEAEQNEIFDWWSTESDPQGETLRAKEFALQEEEMVIRDRGTQAHVMYEQKDKEPMAYVLFRGEYDKRRDEVKAGTPEMLPPLREDLPRNRLGFARWLLEDNHPLTARVTVNRYWQEVFGSGLVRTSGDFGVSGELPTNQELLDWLAVEFRESGWDIKHIFRLIVTSSAYRQAAVATPEKLEKDPQNLLLSRGARFRMDAEMVRDYALAASGLLVRKQGGPSVRPYQPEGVWEAVAMRESDTHYYKPDSGEGLYRRSLYTFWKRAAPPASMEVFNAPSREVCTMRRDRTNTPLQALATLNDVQFVEAARHLAEVAIKSKPDSSARLHLIAQRVLSRPWRADELPVVQSSLIDLIDYYVAHPDDAQKLITVGESKPDESITASMLAAYTMIANEALNLDEVLNK